MTSALAFSKAFQAILDIEVNPIPQKLFVRHRSEYVFILSKIHLSNCQHTEVSVNTLLNYSKFGSQPTLCKRINELEEFKFITSQKSADQRVRSFEITKLGEQYLEECSQILRAIYATHSEG